MNALARSLAPAVVALVLVAAPASAQNGAVADGGSVAGTWLFSMDSPDGTSLQVPFTFEQSGSDVTGTVDLSAVPQAQAVEITDGVFEDGVLFFLLHVGAQDQWMTVEVEAEVDGDEMVGEAYIPDMGQIAPFTAKRGG